MHGVKNIKRFYDPVRVALASSSNLFLEGIGGILQDGNDIEVSAKVSSYDELTASLSEVKPDFLFLDNNTIDVDIGELVNLITGENSDMQIILLGDEAEIRHPNITYVGEQTGSSELVEVIREKTPNKRSFTVRTNRAKKETCKLTEMELKVTELIENGYNNKEAAKKLGISEKTVKAHLTNIFVKLEIHNRYQLIVYAKQARRKTK